MSWNIPSTERRRRAHHVIRVARHSKPGSWIRVTRMMRDLLSVSTWELMPHLVQQPGDRSRIPQGRVCHGNGRALAKRNKKIRKYRVANTESDHLMLMTSRRLLECCPNPTLSKRQPQPFSTSEPRWAMQGLVGQSPPAAAHPTHPTHTAHSVACIWALSVCPLNCHFYSAKFTRARGSISAQVVT